MCLKSFVLNYFTLCTLAVLLYSTSATASILDCCSSNPRRRSRIQLAVRDRFQNRQTPIAEEVVEVVVQSMLATPSTPPVSLVPPHSPVEIVENEATTTTPREGEPSAPDRTEPEPELESHPHVEAQYQTEAQPEVGVPEDRESKETVDVLPKSSPRRNCRSCCSRQIVGTADMTVESVDPAIQRLRKQAAAEKPNPCIARRSDIFLEPKCVGQKDPITLVDIEIDDKPLCLAGTCFAKEGLLDFFFHYTILRRDGSDKSLRHPITRAVITDGNINYIWCLLNKE